VKHDTLKAPFRLGNAGVPPASYVTIEYKVPAEKVKLEAIFLNVGAAPAGELCYDCVQGIGRKGKAGSDIFNGR